MRLRYVGIIVVVLAFFVVAVRAKAQSPAATSPTPTYGIPSPLPTMPMDIAIPGTNCGNSSDTVNGTNKCCFNKPLEPKLIDWGFPFDGIAGIINNALKDRLNPILEKQKQVKTEACSTGMPSIPGDLGNAACVCAEPTSSPLSAILPLCDRIATQSAKGFDDTEKNNCIKCLSGDQGKTSAGAWTSIGCVSGNFSDFIQKTLLGWGIGLAGGVSMLCIMYAAFMMQTSRGNAEAIKKAQQLLTSCIMGLMLAIFSIFILKLIGVDILRIPGFTK